MNNKLDIKKASVVEINDLLNVYTEKVKWLRESNIPLWDESQFTIECLNRKYKNPEFFVVISDSVLVGGFILVEQDNEYWPASLNNKAFYFHKFVIKNGYGSLGYSKIVLDWVKWYGKKHNKKYIRLDFDDSREYIKNMYLSSGFTPIDRVYDKSGRPLIKAEFRIL